MKFDQDSISEVAAKIEAYFIANPEKLQRYHEIAAAMREAECYPFDAGKERCKRIKLGRSPEGKVFKASLRTLLRYALFGQYDLTMPLSTCEKGCCNPHHFKSLAKTDVLAQVLAQNAEVARNTHAAE